MPPEDAVERDEFEGYIRRHEADHFAHAPMRHDFRNDLISGHLIHEARLGSLERWQQRIVGAVAMLTFLVTCGVVAAVIELLRHG